MKRSVLTSIAIATLFAGFALPGRAADGAVPLWEPTVITTPGSYVVTRSITAASGPVFDVQVGGVSLNLNGHTLGVTNAADPILAFHVTGVDPQPFHVGDGSLVGGMYGIHALGGARASLSLNDVSITGAAEAAVKMDEVGDLEARGIVVVDSKVGFELLGSAPDPNHPAARVADSSIRADRGIRCTGVSCSIVRNTVASCVTPLILDGAGGSEAEQNLFDHPAAICGFNPQPEPPGHAVHVTDSPGVAVRDNRLIGANVANGSNHGIVFDGASDGGTIAGNVVRGFGDDGIVVTSSACRIRDNMVSGNGGVGLRLGGENLLALGNTLIGNVGVGVYFEGGLAVPPVWRDNILTGNAAGVNGPGLAAAIDGGGNVE